MAQRQPLMAQGRRGRRLDRGYQAITHEPGAERQELAYTRGRGADRKQVHQAVRLCHTVPHYGGRRWWMICPFRNIRVGKLYMPPGGDRFVSRQAWRLGYQCQHDAAREPIRTASPATEEAGLHRPKGSGIGPSSGTLNAIGNWTTNARRKWRCCSGVRSNRARRPARLKCPDGATPHIRRPAPPCGMTSRAARKPDPAAERRDNRTATFQNSSCCGGHRRTPVSVDTG